MKYSCILALAVGLASCGGEKGMTEVKSKISGYANQKIYITSSFVIDSVVTDKHGTFKHSMVLADPAYVRFTNEEKSLGFILLLDPEDKASVKVGDSTDWQKNISVKGSEGSMLLVELGNHYQASIAALEEIKSQYSQKIMGAPDDTQLMEINMSTGIAYDSVMKNERAFLVEYIKRNNHSLAAISALYQTFDYNTGMPILLDDADGINLFIEIDSILWNRFPNAPDVQSFHQNVQHIRAELAKQNADSQSPQVQITTGSEAPEIRMADPNGTMMSLHSLKGKYVLLDFWASWCAPCREESPILVDAYKMYNAKGFEIFQVSLDKTHKAWADAIAKDGLLWKHHVSDLQFWNSAAAQLYGIQGIPANYLLDKNGIVIAKNLRGAELAAKLKEIFR